MAQIIAFQSRDGQIFEKEADCTARDNELNFLDWYKDNELSGRWEGSRIEGHEIKSWLWENRAQVAKLLNLKD